MGLPYPGTRPFRREDSDRFFGRAREASALAELWRANRLTMLVGPTGCGKTSLVQAGLFPLVEAARAEILPPGRVSYGATFPAAALPDHNPYTAALLASWSPDEPMGRLAGLTVRGYLRRRAEFRDGTVLAVIDQAEELLADSGPRRTHRRRFLGELAEALTYETRLHLLVCVRESSLEEFSAVLGSGAQCRVGPLSFDGAVNAITGPAEAAGRGFGPGAAEELVTDLLTSSVGDPADPGWSVIADSVEPVLLQAACVRLWGSLPPTVDRIGKRDVHHYGDVDVALRSFCGQVIAEVADEHDVAPARVRAWLVRTFINDRGRRGSAYEGLTDTEGMPTTLAWALEDRHLLTSERRSGSRWYELLSERLIHPLRGPTAVGPTTRNGAELLGQAAHVLALGDLDLAERYAREAISVSPADDLRLQAAAYSFLGNLAHEREKPADAELLYSQAAALYEAARDPAAAAQQLAAIAQTLLDRDRMAEAIQELRAAVGRLPHDAVLQTRLGWALWQLGQSRTAEAVFTGVLAMDGGNAEALRGRGEILAERGDARAALRDLDRLVAVDQPSAQAARGLALAQLGQQAEAEKEIKAALDEVRHHGPALLYAAQTEAISGDRARAVELAERALNATDPALPQHQRRAAQEILDSGGLGALA
jgi:tetratricopeptide (TPR) repeat protein